MQDGAACEVVANEVVSVAKADTDEAERIKAVDKVLQAMVKKKPRHCQQKPLCFVTCICVGSYKTSTVETCGG